MRIFSVATAWCLSVILVGSAAAATQEPPLPSWDEVDLKELNESGWQPGNGLLSDDPLPDEVESPTEAPLEVDNSKAEEMLQEEPPSPEVPEKFLQAYFGARPEKFLVDPQGLLAASDFRDRLAFLDYHASDSSIDLFVYIVGGDQEIPSEVREEEMIERFFSEGRPAVVVFYYLGSPQRSVVYLSPSITDEISAAEQHRALESSLIQAFERTDYAEQFERFLVQMSIRIYWMERMLSGQPEAASASPEEMVIAEASSSPTINADKARLQQLVAKFAVPVMAAVALLLVLFGIRHWLRGRARYQFPEFEVEPRLGGSHAAGVGAVISFVSPALPPASQRDQVPDYLRRN